MAGSVAIPCYVPLNNQEELTFDVCTLIKTATRGDRDTTLFSDFSDLHRLGKSMQLYFIFNSVI